LKKNKSLKTGNGKPLHKNKSFKKVATLYSYNKTTKSQKRLQNKIIFKLFSA